jgi:hypothetical protein
LCRWGSTNIKPADSRYDRGTSGGQVIGGEQWAETVPPEPHCLVAKIDAAFEEEVFNLPQAEWEAHKH